MFNFWAVFSPILVLCIMFINQEGFVYLLNMKTSPHPDYMVTILLLGVAGGLFCFCWEVQKFVGYKSFLFGLSAPKKKIFRFQ